MVDQPRSAHGLSQLTELAGGLLVGLGLLASPGGAAATGLLLFVVLCTYLGHSFWSPAGEFEFPLSLAGAMTALALALAAAESPVSWHRVLSPSLVGPGPLAGLTLALVGAFLVLASREIRRRA